MDGYQQPVRNQETARGRDFLFWTHTWTVAPRFQI
jgi:hypothetical protein